MAAPANDAWGQASTVTPGSTATLASVIAPAGYVVMGLIGTGTGEGYFSVRVGSLVVASGRIRSAAPTLDIALPNGIAVAAGAQVVLAVTNEADATAAYEGTLLGA